MNKNLIKNILFYIGTFAMFLAGVLFVIMSDLSIKNTSDRLIVSVLFSFGSAIAFFLANSLADKPKAMYVVKGIALALAVAFVVYIHVFSNGQFYTAAVDKLIRGGLSTQGQLATARATIILALILGYISTLAQAANIACVALFKED